MWKISSKLSVNDKGPQTSILAQPASNGTQTDEVQEWDGLESSVEDSAQFPPARTKEQGGITQQPHNRQQNNRAAKLKKQLPTDTNNANGSRTKGNAFEALGHIGSTADEVDVSAWGNLKLSSQILSSLARMRFSTPTPIQKAAIPEILDGHEIIGKAPQALGKRWHLEYQSLNITCVVPTGTERRRRRKTKSDGDLL